MLPVGPVRGLDSLDVDPVERLVEAWCVVGRFPGVEHRDETVDETLPAEPDMPCLDSREDILQERAIRCDLVEDADRGREHRRLREPARRDGRRAIAVGRPPELRSGAVVDRLRVEDDVRHHPVCPLAAQERPHLGAAAFGSAPARPRATKAESQFHWNG